MTVRRFAAALVLVPALLLTAACGDDSGDKASSSESQTPKRKVPVSMTGAAEAAPTFGAAPEIKVPDGNPPPGVVSKALSEGTGPVVTDKDMVKVNYEGVAWKTKTVFDSSFERQQPIVFPLNGVIKGWAEGLTGKKVGSRVLITIEPEKGYGAEGNPPDIGKNETLVFVVDIISAMNANSTAQGTAVNVTDPVLPKVLADANSKKVTGITASGKPAPTALVSQNVVEGTGAPVEQASTVYVNYSMWLWDGTPISQTWESAPSEWQMGGLLPGLNEGLLGKKVGSRVLLVLPPDKAWGAKGNETAKVPANATIVWSVDILAVA